MTFFSILIVGFSFVSTVSFFAVMITVIRSGQIARIEERRGLSRKMHSHYSVRSIVPSQPKSRSRLNR